MALPLCIRNYPNIRNRKYRAPELLSSALATQAPLSISTGISFAVNVPSQMHFHSYIYMVNICVYLF